MRSFFLLAMVAPTGIGRRHAISLSGRGKGARTMQSRILAGTLALGSVVGATVLTSSASRASSILFQSIPTFDDAGALYSCSSCNGSNSVFDIFTLARACPQLEDSQADYRVIHRRSADFGADRCAAMVFGMINRPGIKDVLPGRQGHVGVTAKDNRLFVEAVLYRYRAGIPWRDLPERFGDPIKIHTRFSRWAKSGVWKKLFEMLASRCRQ